MGSHKNILETILMILFILFTLCILVIVRNKNNTIPVIFISSLFIPITARLGGGIAFDNALVLLGGVIYFLNRKKYKDDEKYTGYFLIYFFLIRLFFAVVTKGVPFDEQLSIIKGVIPIAFIYVEWRILNLKSADKTFKYFNRALLLAAVYGIYTYITQTNPYINFLSDTFYSNDFVEIQQRYAEEARGFMQSRATGVTYSPLEYAILLVICSYIPIYYSIRIKKNIWVISTILLSFIAIFLTGSRGPLIAFVLPLFILAIWHFKGRKKAYFILAIIFSGYLLLNADFTAKYLPFVKSFILIFDESKSNAANIEGSSVSGRLIQLEACLHLLQNQWTLWFGNGLGYTTQYLNKYGFFTDSMGFESMIFTGLVNSGILGLVFIDLSKFIFLFFITKKYYQNNKIDKLSFQILISFLLTNFIYNVTVSAVNENVYLYVYFFILKVATLKYPKYQNK